MCASVVLLNDRLHFSGLVDGNDPVSIDYTPPLGDGLGYTSLELLLLSLASCLGSAVLTFLRRMNRTVSQFGIQATGFRYNEHPTGFKTIRLLINLTSEDVTMQDIEGVVKLAEQKYCPVWAMIKGNTEISVSYNIY